MSATTEISVSATGRDTLVRLITALASDKAALGRRYGEWAVSAPTLESAVAAAAMAQDELGHARSTFPLLKQLGVFSKDEDGMETVSTMRLLNEPLTDWEAFIAVNLVVDGMLSVFVAAAQNSSFVQLAQRARKILQEEQSHATHASAWARRLAAGDSRARFLEAIYDCWSQVSVWPGDAEAYAALVVQGLVTGSVEDLRTATQKRIVAALDGTDLAGLWS